MEIVNQEFSFSNFSRIMTAYKDKLNTLKSEQDNFKYLEAHSSVVGATSIGQLKTLSECLVSHCKDVTNLVKDPFEPAVLENFTKSLYDLGSTLQIAEYTPDEIDFDARDILVIDELENLFDQFFRCVVGFAALKQEFPHALNVFELILHAIVYQACVALELDDEDWDTLTGTFPTGVEPIITFKKLPEQKYFTDEEKQTIAESEAAAKQAAKEARDRAALQERMSNLIDHISAMIIHIVVPGANDIFEKLKNLTPARLLGAYRAYELVYGNTPVTHESICKSFVGSKEHPDVTTGDIVCLMDVISSATQTQYIAKDEESYSVLTDRDSTSTIAPDHVYTIMED